MNTSEETEYIRVLNLCRLFDCDRKTMERLLDKLAESHQVEVLVWNGELQVISGRHRFAKLMEDEQAEYCNAYVFNEDEAHDERWARMLDYENNMRDDQADELTSATYVRETGLTDAELKDRGLMRNGTRCKRGALIGRFARQELWTRFKNGVIEPKDAEIICNLTRNISRQSIMKMKKVKFYATLRGEGLIAALPHTPFC